MPPTEWPIKKLGLKFFETTVMNFEYKIALKLELPEAP